MSKAPDFSTTVEVDVLAEELIDAGWIYAPDGIDVDDLAVQEVVDKVKDWHDRNHVQDPWKFCDHELCREVRR